jgi:tetratricopeptide (TPR) repeat protein
MKATTTMARLPLPPVAAALGAAVLIALAMLAALQGLSALALQRGDELRGDPPAALVAYREAVARAPWDAAAWERLAGALLASSDFAAARDAYGTAALLGGWTADRRVGLAGALVGLGQDDAALTAYEAAQALDPLHVPALGALAVRYWARGDWDGAERAYGALLVAVPDRPAAEAAEDHYRYGLLVYASATAVAREHLAQAALDARYAARVPGLLDALAAADAIGDPAYRAGQLGTGLIGAGEYALAGRLFQQAVTLNPGYSEAYSYLGLCHDRTGGDGAPYINRALVLNPASGIGRMIAGYHWRDRGQWRAARDEFERALAIDRRNAAAAALIGEMYIYEGQAGAAEVRLREATELAPEVPGFWVGLALFYLDVTGQVPLGLEAAERAAALAPDDPLVLDALGWARWLSADAAGARTLLEAAYAAEPELASVAYHLGVLYAGSGEPAAARRAFERVLALEPTGSYGRRARLALEAPGPTPEP